MKSVEIPAATERHVIDHDIHGLMGVRLINATSTDAGSIARHLGAPTVSPPREPDITVSFVDRLRVGEPLRYVDRGTAAYALDEFVLLDHGRGPRVSIAFDELGRSMTIVAERGARLVPLLMPILNASMLARGVVPIHGAAFTFGAAGMVATGWSGAGKTGVLLGALQAGARLIAPEWVYVPGGGERMVGLRQPLRVRNWHLRQLRPLGRSLARRDRARLRALDMVSTVAVRGPRLLRRRTARFAAAIEHRAFADLGPDRLPHLTAVSEARLRAVVLLTHRSKGGVLLEPIAQAEGIERLSALMRAQWLDLLHNYLRFRFAFPGRKSDLIEGLAEQHHAGLTQALANKEIYMLTNPWPPSIEAIGDVLRSAFHERSS
ncbi:MAG: hypothetical protein H0X16_01360 [Chloroflexi bacterium]|nr:hypothetical protein [Chloroflexota bacterium]